MNIIMLMEDFTASLKGTRDSSRKHGLAGGSYKSPRTTPYALAGLKPRPTLGPALLPMSLHTQLAGTCGSPCRRVEMNMWVNMPAPLHYTDHPLFPIPTVPLHVIPLSFTYILFSLLPLLSFSLPLPVLAIKTIFRRGID